MAAHHGPAEGVESAGLVPAQAQQSPVSLTLMLGQRVTDKRLWVYPLGSTTHVASLCSK
jgi:hypothetical protein